MSFSLKPDVAPNSQRHATPDVDAINRKVGEAVGRVFVEAVVEKLENDPVFRESFLRNLEEVVKERGDG